MLNNILVSWIMFFFDILAEILGHNEELNIYIKIVMKIRIIERDIIVIIISILLIYIWMN